MKVVTVVGARPQYIKAGPVGRALVASGIDECLVDTGQHYDDNMVKVHFEDLGLAAPKHSLGIGSGPHGQMTGRMMAAVERVLDEERPDAVLVFGDTNTTLAGALAAAKMGIAVVHVEAGLRSFRPTMPEEINRKLTDHLSTVLFCPSKTAIENLRREGIGDETANAELLTVHEAETASRKRVPWVLNVGDVMVDALLDRRRADEPLVDQFGCGNYAVATVHRAEATDQPDVLIHLVKSIAALGAAIPVILPLHPRTKTALERLNVANLVYSAPGIRCVEPLGYSRFMTIVANARLVVTDSGGVQKEACILGVLCLTLRDETEWTETVASGWNRLLGGRPNDLLGAALAARAPAARPPELYGDGRAAQRIAAVISRVPRELRS